jgi:hypothetical protein
VFELAKSGSFGFSEGSACVSGKAECAKMCGWLIFLASISVHFTWLFDFSTVVS